MHKKKASLIPLVEDMGPSSSAAPDDEGSAATPGGTGGMRVTGGASLASPARSASSWTPTMKRSRSRVMHSPE